MVYGSTVQCAGSRPSAGQGSPTAVNTIGRQQAIELAQKELVAKGWAAQNYDMTVQEQEASWLIEFVGKPPRPPGSEMTVVVSKQDGKTQVSQGE